MSSRKRKYEPVQGKEDQLKLLEKKGEQVVIYILPDRIQRARLKILQNIAQKKGFKTKDNFDTSVSHIVTGYNTRNQVEEHFATVGVQLSDEVKVVSIDWFTECSKASCILEVADKHELPRLKDRLISHEQEKTTVLSQMPKFACQRRSPLNHSNKKYVEALLTLADFADLRNDPSQNDYGRSLAFNKAAAVLKWLPNEIQHLDEVKKLRDVGEHSRQVIEDIFSNGFSREIEEVCGDWYRTLKMFTHIYGIGPATAKKWYDMGMRSLSDVVVNDKISLRDERLIYGTAFYSDLNSKVSRREACRILDLVQKELKEIDRDCTAELMGGFRRGKTHGHDCDILLCHPVDGREVGLVSKLVAALQTRGMVLHGVRQSNTYNPQLLSQPGTANREEHGIDEFEKYLGIIKFERSQLGLEEMGEEKGEEKRGEMGEEFKLLHILRQKVERSGELTTDRKELLNVLSTSTSARNWVARRVDLVVIPMSQYPYAVVGWTGNKNFNRSIRLYAKKILNIKLSSHGMWDFNKQCHVLAKSEREVFGKLKLDYIEPQDRNV